MRPLFALALLAALGTAACGAGPPREATLVRDLPNVSLKGAESVFAQRVFERFPLGSSEAHLVAELKRQGFDEFYVLDQRDIAASGLPPSPSAHVAKLKWGDMVCNMGADVTWTADESGRLTYVRGTYGERGCL